MRVNNEIKYIASVNVYVYLHIKVSLHDKTSDIYIKEYTIRDVVIQHCHNVSCP